MKKLSLLARGCVALSAGMRSQRLLRLSRVRCDRNPVRLAPLRYAVCDLKVVHRDFEFVFINFYQNVVVVDFLALERIIRRSSDRYLREIDSSLSKYQTL